VPVAGDGSAAVAASLARLMSVARAFVCHQTSSSAAVAETLVGVVVAGQSVADADESDRHQQACRCPRHLIHRSRTPAASTFHTYKPFIHAFHYQCH